MSGELWFSEADYARLYQVNVRTIRRWKATPLFDLDDPKTLHALVGTNNVQPASWTWNGAKNWNDAWLQLAEERGLLEE